MAYYLLKIKINWADELDFKGIVVLDEDKYTEFKKKFEKVKEILKDTHDVLYVCFGSNEYGDYDADYLTNVFKAEEITEAQYNTLTELHLNSVGNVSVYDAVTEYYYKHYVLNQKDKKEDE